MLIVRITGLGAAGFVTGAEGDFGVSVARGLMVLNLAAGVDAGADLRMAVSGGVTASVFGRATGVVGVVFVSLIVALGFGAAVLVAAAVALFLVGVAVKYSCALNTCKHEPQRTAPLADCSWLGVTRKAVPHLGQRVIIWLLAEVMIYLLLTHRG